jgi:hypothetical protein
MRAAMTDGVMGRGVHCTCGIGDGSASSSPLWTDSSRCGQDFRNANEIIGGRGQYEEPFHQAAAAMSGFAQATGRHGGWCAHESLLRPDRSGALRAT